MIRLIADTSKTDSMWVKTLINWIIDVETETQTLYIFIISLKYSKYTVFLYVTIYIIFDTVLYVIIRYFYSTFHTLFMNEK